LVPQKSNPEVAPMPNLQTVDSKIESQVLLVGPVSMHDFLPLSSSIEKQLPSDLLYYYAFDTFWHLPVWIDFKRSSMLSIA
jgi:hypothetical protein